MPNNVFTAPRPKYWVSLVKLTMANIELEGQKIRTSAAYRSMVCYETTTLRGVMVLKTHLLSEVKSRIVSITVEWNIVNTPCPDSSN